jgi:hypothetical protein
MICAVDWALSHVLGEPTDTRNAAAPAFAGLTLAHSALGLPFLIAGRLKIVYDLAILMVFRDVRPPEEMTRRRTV